MAGVEVKQGVKQGVCDRDGEREDLEQVET